MTVVSGGVGGRGGGEGRVGEEEANFLGGGSGRSGEWGLFLLSLEEASLSLKVEEVGTEGGRGRGGSKGGGNNRGGGRIGGGGGSNGGGSDGGGVCEDALVSLVQV